MIDKDLIIDKEDYIKNDLINSLKIILNETNKNNINNNILEINNKLKEFNLINESNFNINDTILKKDSIDNLIETILNTKYYNLNQTSFIELEQFIKNALITIGAESSIGKTSFVTQLSLDILINNDDTILAFYTLDDSKTFLLKKMILYLFDKYKIIKKYQYNDKELIDIININRDKTLNIINSGRISIFETINIYSLYSQLLKFRKNAIDTLNIKDPNLIVVIDYLQIIEHDNNSLREGLNKVCKELKDIQKKLNCMFLIISQFNRPKEKETNVNTLTRYRETSEIENVSDICINLERVLNIKKYNTKLYVVKNKFGEKDHEFISFRNAYTFGKFNKINEYDKNNDEKVDFNENNEYNEYSDNIDDLIF